MLGVVGVLASGLPAAAKAHGQPPVEEAQLTYAPQVPPPITRRNSAVVRVHLDSNMKTAEITSGVTYPYWAFNDHVPGPFIRARRGYARGACHEQRRERHAA